MFVFKAAVVGAGTMGGQIAQTIAAAGIPVVLKDIDDALVQAGLDEARNVTTGQIGKLVEKGKITAEQADEQIEQIVGRIDGTTSYAALRRRRLRDRGGARADGDQAGGVRRARRRTPGHAMLASNTSSLSITEIAEATLRPDKVDRLSLLLPGLDHAADRDRRGRGDLRRDGQRGGHVRADDPQAADHLRRGARLRRQPHPQLLGHLEVWREQEEKGLSIKKIDEGVGAAGVLPLGPYLLVNLLGLDTVLHVAEHLVESYGEERFYVPKGMQKLVAEGKLGAKTGGDGFYDPQGEPEPPRRRRPRHRRARRAALAEDVPRGVPGARGGRRHPPRHRLRDDGRRRPRPAPRADAAVHARRRRGPGRGARAHGERAASATASASRRRRSCAAWSRRAASARRPARASTPTRSPTPSSRPR